MKDNSAPVHVLMATYNSAKTIETAMASVLNQSHSNLTLLIQDDGSTDNTLTQIYTYLQQHPEHKDRIILEKNNKNLGVAQTRQILLSHSKKHNPRAYLLWLDSDDQYTDLTFIQTLIVQMRETQADIGLFNYAIVYDADISESSKCGLEEDRQTSTEILKKIKASKNKTVSAENFPELLRFTSFGCTKCYAPTVELPTPDDCPFEDFVYMAALLKAKKVVAFDPQKYPFQYTRHATSICGNRLPENFTTHIPRQLVRFYNIMKDCHDDTQQLALAEKYIQDMLRKYGKILHALIKEKRPGFTTKTLEKFNRVYVEYFSSNSA